MIKNSGTHKKGRRIYYFCFKLAKNIKKLHLMYPNAGQCKPISFHIKVGVCRGVCGHWSFNFKYGKYRRMLGELKREIEMESVAQTFHFISYTYVQQQARQQQLQIKKRATRPGCKFNLINTAISDGIVEHGPAVQRWSVLRWLLIFSK